MLNANSTNFFSGNSIPSLFANQPKKKNSLETLITFDFDTANLENNLNCIENVIRKSNTNGPNAASLMSQFELYKLRLLQLYFVFRINEAKTSLKRTSFKADSKIIKSLVDSQTKDFYAHPIVIYLNENLLDKHESHKSNFKTDELFHATLSPPYG